MKSKRKLPLVVTAVTLVMLLLVGLTVAYLTDSRNTLNLLGIGVDEKGDENVEIDIEEPGFNGTPVDPDDVDNVEDYFEGGKVPDGTDISKKPNILPGAELNKDPLIRSLGNEPVYVRAKLVLGGVSEASNKTEYDKRFKMLTDLGLVISDKFFLHTDGYYYYVDAAGDPATLAQNDGVALFVPKTNAAGQEYTLKIPSSWNNNDVQAFRDAFKTSATDTSKLVGINVVAEAIQSTGFSGDFGWIDPDTNQPIEVLAVKDQNRRP